MDVKDPSLAPTEVLIPEAREHQKRRYLWTGLIAALAALVLAAMIGGAVILFSGSPARRAGPGTRRRPLPHRQQRELRVFPPRALRRARLLARSDLRRAGEPTLV